MGLVPSRPSRPPNGATQCPSPAVLQVTSATHWALRGLFRIRSYPPHVAAAAQAGTAHTEPLGALNRQLRGPPGPNLAEIPLPIHQRGSGSTLSHQHLRARHDGTATDVFYILRYAQYSVRRQAHEIGLYQQAGHRLRLLGRSAVGLKNGGC